MTTTKRSADNGADRHPKYAVWSISAREVVFRTNDLGAARKEREVSPCDRMILWDDIEDDNEDRPKPKPKSVLI